MTAFGPQTANEILAACQSNAAEIAAAFSRAFETPLQVAACEPVLDLERLEQDLNGAGLAMVFHIGQLAALALLNETSGLLPQWYLHPDATGGSKLATLAQELGLLLLPAHLAPQDFQAAHVNHLGQALARGRLADEAGRVSLSLSTADGQQGRMYLIWPATQAGAVIETREPEQAIQPMPEIKPVASQEFPAAARPASARRELPPMASEDDLPSYARSLLRIEVPLTVMLAAKRQQVARILELGPGSIIQFEKSCEEMLDLEVGGHSIALGEAVKVGDKFGIRLTSMILPEEHFKPLQE